MNYNNQIEQKDIYNAQKIELEDQMQSKQNNYDDQEDDWNPLPPQKENSILNKLRINFTNKEIKQQGDEHFKDVKFDLGEFADFNENDLDDYFEGEQKEDNKGQRNKNINQKENEYADFDEEDIEVDDSNKLFQDNKKAIKKLRQQIQNEDIFFNPIEDEEDDTWVKHNLKSNNIPKANTILSCPCCFVQLCYDSQRHEYYDNQYRAICVKNIKINTTKIIQPLAEDEAKNQKDSYKNKFRRNRRKQKKNKQEEPKNDLILNENDDLTKENLEELEKKIDAQKDSFLVYFSAECVYCSTEVAAYELNEKMYHFFNVIPSLG